MSRIKFARGSQARFLFVAKQRLNLSWSLLAKKINAHPRSVSDWRREKYTLPRSVYERLAKIVGRTTEKIPRHKVLSDHWNLKAAARKGGLVTAARYGGPGTASGRKKGGVRSQLMRKLHPERYSHCNIRKKIRTPRNSAALAEFVGIILGDGGINNDHQVVITLHKKHDLAYAKWICILIRKLFAIDPVIYYRRSTHKENVIEIVLGGINIVEFLLAKGLLKGSKVKHKIDVPKWIKENKKFSIHCLKGLIDTDGGVFYHRHRVGGRNYLNLGLQFSNASKPLLMFADNTFRDIGYTPKIASLYLNLYKQNEILRYMREVRFHNPYHAKRVEKFVKIMKSNAWRDARVA